jgi:hypothetical protein
VRKQIGDRDQNKLFLPRPLTKQHIRLQGLITTTDNQTHVSTLNSQLRDIQCNAKIIHPFGVFPILLHYDLSFKWIFIWISCNGHTQK